MDFSSLECVFDLRKGGPTSPYAPANGAALRLALTRSFSPALRHARSYVVLNQVLDTIPGPRPFGHSPAPPCPGRWLAVGRSGR
eukprot:2187214-Heterocapsa_arctica.AAC.1